jgi:hypothetical protein
LADPVCDAAEFGWRAVAGIALLAAAVVVAANMAAFAAESFRFESEFELGAVALAWASVKLLAGSRSMTKPASKALAGPGASVGA